MTADDARALSDPDPSSPADARAVAALLAAAHARVEAAALRSLRAAVVPAACYGPAAVAAAVTRLRAGGFDVTEGPDDDRVPALRLRW